MATQADKINTGALATVIIVLAISTLGIAAALTALVRYETASHGAEKGVSANLRSYRELVATQRSELTAEPKWVDKDKQLVSVPIERAMELVVQDLRKDANLATEGGAAGDAGAAAATTAGDAGAAAAPSDAGATAEAAGDAGAPGTSKDGGAGARAPKQKPNQ